jgi:hypothetical protein
VIANYCAYARAFLDHLERRNMAIADMTKAQVEKYLHDEVVCSANAMVDHPGRTGVRSRARASMRCCGLRRASGRPRRG